jgi:sialate O-acetylesterase
VSIDVGEADDVHPRNKTEIGERLAAWALATTYRKNLVYSGPLFESVIFQENRAIVTFNHTGSGLVADDQGQLRGFAMAGENREFHWATARIVGSTVEVFSREVQKPVALRYGWANNPDCNLYNKEGFPAAPFRTDNWPGLTINEK